jgi:hypothetical protein
MIQEPEPLIPLQPEIFASLPQEAKVYNQSLEKHVVWLMTQVQGLVTKVQQLEDRLAKDSSNIPRADRSLNFSSASFASQLIARSYKLIQVCCDLRNALGHKISPPKI